MVKAEQRSARTGDVLAAGIGWYQFYDGRGLFVEHELVATSKCEAQAGLRQLIDTSLRELCMRRGIPFDGSSIGRSCALAEVTDVPACALALAIYRAEPWS